MERQYSVMLNGQHTGKVCVTRRGLYYHFSCRCRLPREDICRLMVSCGTVRESLGVLVPADGEFGLETRIPVKQIGEGELCFTVTGKQEPAKGRFVPIRADEPFAYISRLKESFLIRKEGQPGIRIEKMQEC